MDGHNAPVPPIWASRYELRSLAAIAPEDVG
jgi:hypothetical protein